MRGLALPAGPSGPGGTIHSIAMRAAAAVSAVLALLAMPSLVPSAHAEDFRLQFPPVKTMSPRGVNLQTGRFHFEREEFAIGPLVADVRYSSSMSSSPFTSSTVFGPFPTLATGNQNISPDSQFNMVLTSLRTTMTPWQLPYSGGTYATWRVNIGQTELQFRGDSLLYPMSYSAWGWKLVASGSNFIVTNKSGDTYTFVDHAAVTGTPRGKVLDNVVYADGHKLTYSYGSQAQLRTIISNRGYAVVVDYNAGANAITVCGYNTAVTYVTTTSTCAASTQKVQYGFTSVSGGLRLTSSTGVDNSVTAFQWNSSYGFLTCVTMPDSSTCPVTNTYGPNPSNPVDLTAPDQVRLQTQAAGGVWNYTYNNGGAWNGEPPPQNGEVRFTQANMQDPQGNWTFLRYANGVLDYVLQNGQTTLFNRDPNNRSENIGSASPCPLSVFHPEGNGERLWEAWPCILGSRTAIPKAGSGLSSTTASAIYPSPNPLAAPTICSAASNALCNKPTSSIDDRGNQTDYTHDATHGGILTKTGPAVNGIRPQVRYTWVQRTAWVKNLAGTYSAASPAVWLLASESYCRTTAASGAGCAGGAGDQVVTTYDYGPNSGPNNLLLRGMVVTADGVSLRTCYRYDGFGRKIAETQPMGNGSSCP